MIYRIIDKETKLFLRDDFTWDAETEIGLSVPPAQGLIAPKWQEHEVLLEGEAHGTGEWVEANSGIEVA